MDIFAFNLNLPAIQTEIVGVAFDPVLDESVYPEITVVDAETMEEVAIFQPDENGDYAFTAQSDRSYVFKVTDNGSAFSNEWYVPKKTQEHSNFQVLMLKDLMNENDAVYANVLEVRTHFDELALETEILWSDYLTANEFPETETFDYIRDTLFVDFATLAMDADYQHFFGYNKNQLSIDDKSFIEWLDRVEAIVNVHGSITVLIEASASKVPTETYVTNTKLVQLRADNTMKIVEEGLTQRGVDLTKVKFELSSDVNGPTYKGDFETGMEVYEQYQYVILSLGQ